MHRSKFEYLKQVRYELLECQGVYGTDSFPRGAQAYLQVAVTPHSSKGSVAIALLNFRDREALARTISGNYWICSQRQIDAKACLPTELGKFHVSATPSLPILNEISSWGQDPLEPSPAASVAASPSAIPSPTAAAVPLVEKMVKRQTRTPNRLMYRYSVNNTGLYCALVGSTQSEPGADYDMKFTAANPYGLLPALFYPALPFFAYLSLVYLVFGSVWMILSFKYWKDLLPLQHFVSAVIAFLLVEMSFNYAFYEKYNETGVPPSFLLGANVIFNAARNALSFFMLLIVSLGYGVVKPTLGTTMNKCISLAVVHTICGAIYGSGTLVATRETSLLVLFFALPISLSMTIFYIWSLNALDNTIEHLVSRRQTVKLAMYKNLQRILAFSGFLLTSILVVNSVNMSHRNEDAWIQEQWQWRWMILDGTLNIAYLVIFASIVYLWRPTSNNERYGLEQLASDDPDEEGAIGGATDTDGIRLRTLHGDGDEDDEEAETAEDILKWAEAHVMKNPFE